MCYDAWVRIADRSCVIRFFTLFSVDFPFNTFSMKYSPAYELELRSITGMMLEG